MDSSELNIERYMIYEHVRMTAEANHAKNPYDADNLLKWAGALVELAAFGGDMNESKRITKDAMAKMEEALQINPAKHEALFCLGNANTSVALMTPDPKEAQIYIDRASLCFQKAVDENPGNEIYVKSLEASAQTPHLHMELQKAGYGQQALGGGPGGPFATPNAKGSVKKASSDLKYDIFGWIILAVGLVAWVEMAKFHEN
ncbi:hypothetical protein RJ640_030838 [Escallonia rubra]|uniref:Mitochondrial import receptor subunit TOM20 n=1 Tax=Escallonia rubra TaxID=112253 RepID=A0AA88QJ19_9ASTE|nr:hypothetical protein RJ640_030838 [Escallonia rubra]